MPAHPARLPVTLIGAPTDIGAGRRGAAMGPEALRVAGIAASLRRLGREVNDGGNLAGPSNPETAAERGYRHLAGVTAWCAAVRDTCTQAFAAGTLPIVMGGDHSLAIGSIAAAAAHCAQTGRPLVVLWLDAHADCNTPETTPTGNLHGMPVAVLTGRGPDALLALGGEHPILRAEQIVAVGIRAIDEKEKALLADMAIEIFDMRRIDELGMRRTMQLALARAVDQHAHLHVSLDVDFLDPAIAPGVPTTVPGGPTYREAQLCMEMIYDTGLLASLDIAELNPALDTRNCTAELVVELVESLFGEQILARSPSSRYDL